MANHLHIEFFHDQKENPAKTREAGRPIFDPVEMVKIRYAGDTKNVHVAPAHEQFKLGDDGAHVTYAQEFPEHYAAFKKDSEILESGTPINEPAFITATKARELKAINIHTVEALASLNQSGIKRLGMGGQSLVEQAKQCLEGAAAGALTAKMAEENTALQKQIDELKAMIASPQPETAPVAETDDPDTWSDDRLKEFLTDQGAEPRSNAARGKMVDAARQFIELKEAA